MVLCILFKDADKIKSVCSKRPKFQQQSHRSSNDFLATVKLKYLLWWKAKKQILHVTVNDCYLPASTWWRETKEASCIMGNAVSGRQREAQIVVFTTVNTCTHRYRLESKLYVSRSPFPPRLHSENGFMNLYSRSEKMIAWAACKRSLGTQSGYVGGFAIFTSTLKQQRNVCQDGMLLLKTVQSVLRSAERTSTVGVAGLLHFQNRCNAFRFGTQKNKTTNILECTCSHFTAMYKSQLEFKNMYLRFKISAIFFSKWQRLHNSSSVSNLLRSAIKEKTRHECLSCRLSIYKNPNQTKQK